MVTPGDLCDYLCKYVSKLEPVFDVKLHGNVSPETQAYLRTEEGMHIHGRICSVMEASARLYGMEHVSMTEGVLFLPTEMPCARTRTLNMKAVKRKAARSIKLTE